MTTAVGTALDVAACGNSKYHTPSGGTGSDDRSGIWGKLPSPTHDRVTRYHLSSKLAKNFSGVFDYAHARHPPFATQSLGSIDRLSQVKLSPMLSMSNLLSPLDCMTVPGGGVIAHHTDIYLPNPLTHSNLTNKVLNGAELG